MGAQEATPRALPASLASSAPQAALPLVTLNDLLWLLYLYPIYWLARVMPRSFLYAIGKLADPVVQLYMRGRKISAVPGIAQACHTTPDHAGSIARASVSHNLLRVLDELWMLRPASNRMLHCDGVEGFHHLESALARGKGVILLVGHFCANKIAARYLAKEGYSPLSVHNRRPSNVAAGWLGRRFLQPRSLKLRETAFPDRVYIQDPECSLKIMRRLRAGGLAMLHLDGRAGTRPIEHPFLGAARRFPSGVLEIVRLSDCAVVPMLCLGRSDGFRIRFEPMLEIVRASSRDAFASTNLPQFLAAIERQIVKNPEEWKLWINFLAKPM